MPKDGAAELDNDRVLVQEIVAKLSEEEAARCYELGVFPGGVRVPTRLVAALWRSRGGLSAAAARRLWVRLAELSETAASGDAAPAVAVERGSLTLSAAARGFLRGALSPDDLAATSGALVDSVVGDLPETEEAGGQVPWWELDRRNAYLWDHLVRHLVEARRGEQAESLLGDPRWAVARVRRSGLDAFADDLVSIETDPLPRLWGALEDVMRVEGYTPTGDRAAVELLGLLSSAETWLAKEPSPEAWRAKVSAVQKDLDLPLLINRWPAPDPGDVEHRAAPGRVLTAAADGAWFATFTKGEKRIRMWDTATGTCLRTLAVVDGSVQALAPDGSWLATVHQDKALRIWDTATGECLAVLTGHTDQFSNAEVAPDGSWLATSDWSGVVRVWETADWGLLRMLTAPPSHSLGGPIALARNGRFLFVPYEGLRHAYATHVWDTSSWTSTHVLGSPGGWGSLVVVPSADGSRVVIRAGYSKKVQVWSSSTGDLLRTVGQSSRHWGNTALSPDGAKLVIILSDNRIRILDAAGTEKPRVPANYDERVNAMEVSPDGRWLATADKRTLRVWEISTTACVSMLRMDDPVTSCAWLPGNLLAVGGKGGTGLYELRLP